MFYTYIMDLKLKIVNLFLFSFNRFAVAVNCSLKSNSWMFISSITRITHHVLANTAVTCATRPSTNVTC